MPPVHPVLGLGANLPQFVLLVVVNAFVGGMVGIERSILPALAEAEFGLAERTAILSFIAVFGVTKALSNYLAGRLGDRWGRKPVLVAGWLIAAPVPFLLMWAPTWNWIIVANVFLGISQGLTWSTAVIMKIDLAGPKNRGLAMGLNEFAGYVAVALAAWATGYVAATYGLRPEPFYLGVGFVIAGLSLSVFLVRETHAFVGSEAASHVGSAKAGLTEREIFRLTTWRDPNLSSATQAGLVNNLNDGLAWGLSSGVRGRRIVVDGDRIACLDLSWRMGCCATGHGRPFGSDRKEVAYRGRHVATGVRDCGNGAGFRVHRLCLRRGVARAGNGHGLSDPASLYR
jgi:MFS family permease